MIGSTHETGNRDEDDIVIAGHFAMRQTIDGSGRKCIVDHNTDTMAMLITTLFVGSVGTASVGWKVVVWFLVQV